jgi:hypothetical protein
MPVLSACPICESTRLRPFLFRESVPVHQNAVTDTDQAALAMERGSLSVACCENCGFVFNRAFDLAKMAYGESYDNEQTHSPVFRQYVDELADHLLHERNVRNSRIVEVGCGNAYFLHKLVDDPAMGNTGVGFDPSYDGPVPEEPERLRIERRFYDAECAGMPADVVVCRHVIEHVPNPVGMLDAVRCALQDSPHAQVYFETPCVDWILRRNVFWDFFYEHCSYFSARSLATAFQRAGFHIERVNHVFGQQYLWLAGQVAESHPSPVLDPGPTPALASAFGIHEREVFGRAHSALAEKAQQSKLAIWGAGAKGATLANLIDPERRLLDCVIDINPNKQGRFLGGSGHPIVSLAEAQHRGVLAALLMNPNYRAEVERMIHTSGKTLALLDVRW